MAATAPVVPQLSLASSAQPTKMTSIKALAESPDLKSIPSSYAYFTNPSEATASDPEDSIPIIDFSLLTSENLNQRSKVIQDLGKACQDWGFFMVVNHGIPENLLKEVMDAYNEFFNMSEEEKREFEDKNVFDPIRYGTSFNVSKEKVFCWRDYVKAFVHPEFHFPHKPIGFSELSLEYCKKIRKLFRELVTGISESLGLKECYIDKVMDLDSSFEIMIGNFYPPCPQPELAMGLAPHSDYSLVTLLIENEIGGLQLQRNGKWINVNTLPNAILVNTGDQLEIFSNGKYKSVVHRAAVNNKVTRISIAVSIGPSADTIVAPASELVDSEYHPPAYLPVKYKEYIGLQQSNQLDGKSCLDRVRVQRE